MIKKINFGLVKTTTELDDNGSTVTVSRNYRAGLNQKPIKKVYEVRFPVRDKKHELAEYMRFRAEYGDKHDLSFRIEEKQPNSDQPYYVVFCYKEIEY